MILFHTEKKDSSFRIQLMYTSSGVIRSCGDKLHEAMCSIFRSGVFVDIKGLTFLSHQAEQRYIGP